jgi:hypothetical protein
VRLAYEWRPGIMLHDLPGGGAALLPQAGTCPAGTLLPAFDLVLNVYDRSITELTLGVVAQCAAWGQPCILVRSKVDEAVAAVAREEGLGPAAAPARVRGLIDGDVSAQVRPRWPTLLLRIVSAVDWQGGCPTFDEAALVDAVRGYAPQDSQPRPRL